jgi:hypothetical protein
MGPLQRLTGSFHTVRQSSFTLILFSYLPLGLQDLPHSLPNTVDSRLSARGLTALRLNRCNVFLKKKFYFP